MAAPDISIAPTNSLVSYQVIAPEPQKLPAVEKSNQSAKSSSDNDNNQRTGQEEQSVGEQVQSTALGQSVKQNWGQDTDLSFSVDDSTKKIIVKVVDSKTKEVIKQIPPEEIVKMAEAMQEYSGAFVDKKV